ncbi:hypothetical protein HAX54_039751 [Datura stramonium]|uniref:Uncharacterized protein n=1 Tax=Datura stramonium TaxID=4076 RepID=A0ABS8Y679_DATST|nr:hypothetical protein [Datura stramonium]
MPSPTHPDPLPPLLPLSPLSSSCRPPTPAPCPPANYTTPPPFPLSSLLFSGEISNWKLSLPPLCVRQIRPKYRRTLSLSFSPSSSPATTTAPPHHCPTGKTPPTLAVPRQPPETLTSVHHCSDRLTRHHLSHPLIFSIKTTNVFPKPTNLRPSPTLKPFKVTLFFFFHG